MENDVLMETKKRLDREYRFEMESLLRLQSLVAALKQAPQTEEIRELMNDRLEMLEMNQKSVSDLSFRKSVLDSVVEAADRDDEDAPVIRSAIERTVQAFGMGFPEQA